MSKPPGVTVTGPLPLQTTGTVMVQVDENDQGDPVAVTLSGSGSGWIASNSSLQLQPAQAPANYLLTFQLSPDTPAHLSLFGLQVFFQTSDPNTQVAVIFFPATGSSVNLGLLHDLTSGDNVNYQLFIGISNSNDNTISWPDPTIAFEPQAESPPIWSKD